MTAIGLVMFVVFFLCGHMCYDRRAREQSALFNIFALLYVIGGALMVAGVARWLWRVMP